MYKRILLLVFAITIHIYQSIAQCAMCKTTVVNNVSNGELSLAEGLNFGIIYLFVTPYLAIIAIGFFWYKSSKKNPK